jgi:hypothetical protein
MLNLVFLFCQSVNHFVDCERPWDALNNKGMWDVVGVGNTYIIKEC